MAKKYTWKAWCTCKVVVLLIPAAFLPFSLPFPSMLLKLPNHCLNFTFNMKRETRKFYVKNVQQKKCTRTAWCTCKVVVLLIPAAFLPFSLPFPSMLLKLPNHCLNFTFNMKRETRKFYVKNVQQKKCTRTAWCTCKVVVLLIPAAFLPFPLSFQSMLLKLPNV